MSFSPKEYRAIYFVAHSRGWKMSLSRRPVVRYKIGERIISVKLDSIVREYERHLKHRTQLPDYTLTTQ